MKKSYKTRQIDRNNYIRQEFHNGMLMNVDKRGYKRENNYVLELLSANGWMPIRYESNKNELEKWRIRNGFRLNNTRIINIKTGKKVR